MEKNNKYIEDEIILCNNDYPEDGVVSHIFDDNEEHTYSGKFGDGVATIHKDPDDEGVPEKLVMVYPSMKEVKANADMARKIREYAGLDTENEINYFHIALKYGIACKPEDVELPF